MNDIKLLKKWLLVDNIKKHENQLFDLIPELKYEKDFDQNSKWHSKDVWNHTLIAISNCDNNFEDRLILLLHDIGKPFSYQDIGDERHFNGHACKSAEISRVILQRLGFLPEKIDELVYLIAQHATTIQMSDINKSNIEYYRRLLKIQKCDGNAYEKAHALLILEKLKQTENYLLDHDILFDNQANEKDMV